MPPQVPGGAPPPPQDTEKVFEILSRLPVERRDAELSQLTDENKRLFAQYLMRPEQTLERFGSEAGRKFKENLNPVPALTLLGGILGGTVPEAAKTLGGIASQVAGGIADQAIGGGGRFMEGLSNVGQAFETGVAGSPGGLLRGATEVLTSPVQPVIDVGQAFETGIDEHDPAGALGSLAGDAFSLAFAGGASKLLRGINPLVPAPGFTRGVVSQTFGAQSSAKKFAEQQAKEFTDGILQDTFRKIDTPEGDPRRLDITESGERFQVGMFEGNKKILNEASGKIEAADLLNASRPAIDVTNLRAWARNELSEMSSLKDVSLSASEAGTARAMMITELRAIANPSAPTMVSIGEANLMLKKHGSAARSPEGVQTVGLSNSQSKKIVSEVNKSLDAALDNTDITPGAIQSLREGRTMWGQQKKLEKGILLRLATMEESKVAAALPTLSRAQIGLLKSTMATHDPTAFANTSRALLEDMFRKANRSSRRSREGLSKEDIIDLKTNSFKSQWEKIPVQIRNAIWGKEKAKGIDGLVDAAETTFPGVIPGQRTARGINAAFFIANFANVILGRDVIGGLAKATGALAVVNAVSRIALDPKKLAKARQMLILSGKGRVPESILIANELMRDAGTELDGTLPDGTPLTSGAPPLTSGTIPQSQLFPGTEGAQLIGGFSGPPPGRRVIQ